jgi:hypothetical protein
MRSPSHFGTRPPCSGRSALPDRCANSCHLFPLRVLSQIGIESRFRKRCHGQSRIDYKVRITVLRPPISSRASAEIKEHILKASSFLHEYIPYSNGSAEIRHEAITCAAWSGAK